MKPNRTGFLMGLVFLWVLSFVIFHQPCFPFSGPNHLPTISLASESDASPVTSKRVNPPHFVYDSPQKILVCTTFGFADGPLHEKVPLPDFLLGQGNKPQYKTKKPGLGVVRN